MDSDQGGREADPPARPRAPSGRAVLVWALLGGLGCAADNAESAGGPAVVESFPAPDDVGVPRLFRALVRVDRRLDPVTVNRATVWIASGPVRVTSAVRFDPIDNTISLEPFTGAPLEPNVRYRLMVSGIRDLAGNPLPARYLAAFTTGSELGALADDRTVGWAEIEPFFQSRCATSGCHAGERAVTGLDLSSGARVRETAIGISPRLRGAGTISRLAEFPLIDVTAGLGRPAFSYMIYKVLGDPNIAGDPMPRDQLVDPSRAITDVEVRLLSDWIRSGAPTD